MLAFLYEEEPGTNNQAERDLRPAVIIRKTGGCNRAASGARVHEVLASILATCKKRRVPIVDYLVALQRTDGDPPSILATPATPT